MGVVYGLGLLGGQVGDEEREAEGEEKGELSSRYHLCKRLLREERSASGKLSI